MSEEKKQYKVIQPIGFGGRREIGEVLELTDEEANALGSDSIQPYTPEADQQDSNQVDQGSGEYKEDEEAAPESGPVTTGESSEQADSGSEQKSE